jgi:hypothetical protein
MVLQVELLCNLRSSNMLMIKKKNTQKASAILYCRRDHTNVGLRDLGHFLSDTDIIVKSSGSTSFLQNGSSMRMYTV